jgi:hypothetical protein
VGNDYRLQFRYMRMNIAVRRREVIMRLATIGIVLVALVPAASALAQNAAPPTTTVRKVLAAAKLPTVTSAPLYFKAQTIALAPGEKGSVSGTNSVLYQLSGSTDAIGLGEPKTLNAGDGLLIASGATLELKAAGGAPSALLQPPLACFGSGAADRGGFGNSEGTLSNNGAHPRSQVGPL